MDREGSYEPIVPIEGGEPQGHGMGGGHGSHWREGANKLTNRVRET